MTTHADTPEFELNIDALGRVRFQHPKQAHAYLKRYAGELIVGQFYPVRAKRSDRQNRAAHVLLLAWARERGWAVDALKQFVLGRVFGWLEFPDPQSGEVLKVLAEPHSSTLSVGQFVEFIDQILVLAAEDGVWLQAPDEYRKAMATVRKRAERKASAA